MLRSLKMALASSNCKIYEKKKKNNLVPNSQYIYSILWQNTKLSAFWHHQQLIKKGHTHTHRFNPYYILETYFLPETIVNQEQVRLSLNRMNGWMQKRKHLWGN